MRTEIRRIVGRWLVVVGGGALLVTTAVGSDVALVEPASLVATTTTRSRCCSSAARMPYVLPVAPATSPQLAPFVSQRCHWYANRFGAPAHVPLSAVSSSPTRAVPEMVGRAVFFGPELEETTAVGSDVALADPSALLAVTTTRTL